MTFRRRCELLACQSAASLSPAPAAEDFAKGLGPMLLKMKNEGASLRQMAARLTDQGIRTPRGGAWIAAAVRNVLART